MERKIEFEIKGPIATILLIFAIIGVGNTIGYIWSLF